MLGTKTTSRVHTNLNMDSRPKILVFYEIFLFVVVDDCISRRTVLMETVEVNGQMVA